MLRCSALLAALALVLLAPGRAWANDEVEDGHRRYAEADFDGALASFERAEQAQTLSRDDLIRLLEGRALAEYALEDLDAASVTVRRLASVAPDHVMSDVVPPELVAMFEGASEALGAGIALRVDPAWTDAGVTLTPILSGDVSGLVRALSVAGRAGADGWVRGDAGGLTLEVPAGVPVEVFAEALGPGDAVLARVGDEASPTLFERPARDEGGVPDWGWGLIGGGAGLVAVAIIVAVAVAASASDVQIAPPRLVPSGS